ncbi:MAG: hypothetical protein KJ666_03240 [Bacteroidetes bacterium]|nr:hypothetical protein [Bacteroidota bacterium]
MFVLSILLVIHILSAVIWLGFFPIEIIMRRKITKLTTKNDTQSETVILRSLISDYLQLNGLTGKIGLIGILLTGVLLTSFSPYYSFFDFTANHWLVTKQMVMIIILIIVGTVYMSSARKLRSSLSMNEKFITEEDVYLVKKFGWVSFAVHILVLINFLLAITHRFLSHS